MSTIPNRRNAVAPEAGTSALRELVVKWTEKAHETNYGYKKQKPVFEIKNQFKIEPTMNAFIVSPNKKVKVKTR